MANTKYPNGTAAIMQAGINFLTDSIKLQPVGSGYTYSDSHSNLSDISVGTNGIGTAVSLSGKSVTGTASIGGVLNASSPLVFTSVPAGPAIKALVMYKDTGTASTSTLIAYIDTATGLPVTPNGGNININFDTGSYKVIAY